MSAIRKVPNIEEVIGKLTKDEKNDLQEWLDKGGSNVECSLANMPNGINPVFFKLDETIPARSGLLMNTSNVCALIAYHRYQDLELYIIDKTTKTYVKSKEYLDINELRRVLMDVSFSATDLDSGDAELGDILVANGEGGVQFVPPREVESDEHVVTFDNVTFTDNQVVLPLSESDVRWDYMQDTTTDCVLVLRLSSGTQVEMRRIHYDTDYVEFGSTLNQEVDGNGIYMSIIYSAKFIETGGVAVIVEFEANKDLSGDDTEYPYLSNITIGGETYYVVDISIINEINAELSEKANVDGNYPTMTVGVADNLSPYSEDSGAEQSKPFIAQGTGTDNNTAIVTTGKLGLLKEKQGNTIVNIILGNQNGSYSTYDSTGKGTFTYDNTSGESVVFPLVFSFSSMISEHKYFINPVKTLSGSPLVYCNNSSQENLKNGGVFIGTVNGLSGIYCRVGIGESVSFEFYPRVHDITSWDADIIADLTENPSHFSWYYNGSLAYNAGSLENANGVKLVCTQGRNIWDEETQIYYGSNLGSKNYIPVFPNKTYYFKITSLGVNTITLVYYDSNKNEISSSTITGGNTTFVIPNNVSYMKFILSSAYGTTYNHDITISLYYTPEQGGEGYNQYYPFVAPKVYDTGSETLKAFDKKLPSGVIERGTANQNIGDLTFESESGGSQPISSVPPILGKQYAGQIAHIISAKFRTVDTDTIWSTASAGTSTENLISIAASGKLLFYCPAYQNDLVGFKTAMANVYCQYEVVDSAKTTEQGTTFPENLEISDYGMMYWLDSNNNLVGIPQGAKFFYPIDTNGFIDDVYSRTNGDAQDIVVQSELSASESARDTVDTQLQNAIGGTLKQMLAITKTESFDNLEVIDLGEQNWSLNSNDHTMYTEVSNMESGTSIILCTNAEWNLYSGMANLPYGHYTTSSNRIYFKTNETNTDTFKSNMKGVLLAYKKASS